MSEVTNFCRLSTTPDKSCQRSITVKDPNENQHCFTSPEWYALTSIPTKGMDKCPFETHMQPVIRKSRMDELIEEYYETDGIGAQETMRKVFAPAVDALERLEKAKNGKHCVMQPVDSTTNFVCLVADIKHFKDRGYKLIGYVVEDK